MRETETETAHERHIRQLTEMAELAMAMARLAHEEAVIRVEAARAGKPVPEGAFGPDLGLTLDRLTRSLRLTVALEDRLIEGRKTRERKAAEEQAARTRKHNDTRKTQVRDFVERLIEHEYEAREADTRLGELYAHWDYDDLHPRYEGVPIPDLVAMVCKTLDIPFDPKDWEGDEDLMEPEPPDPDAPPQGELSAKLTEGVEAHLRSSSDSGPPPPEMKPPPALRATSP